MTRSSTDDSAPLLHAIANLSRFHRNHEKYYASAPREQAVALQRHIRTLQALADRWSTVEPARPDPFSPFEGADDLTDPAALQLDGVLFMEGEGEPAELGHLKREVRAIADDCLAVGEWLAAAMDASWEVATQLVPIPELADLLGDRHRIIANDWLAAHMSTMAGRSLIRAGEILEQVDLSPAALRIDLAGDRLAPERLLSACELASHAADLLSDSAGLVNDNERRWRTFRHRVQGLLDDHPESRTRRR